MAIPISAVVMTKNEETNIVGCLASLVWADELLVVDSGSTDNTQDIARTFGARVVEHPFANFAAQRNYAQSQACHNWVLFIDADECVTPALRREILELARGDRLLACHAYHIRRVHLRSGEWFGKPEPVTVTPQIEAGVRASEVCRLLDRRLGVWQRALHEFVDVPEPHGILASPILHFASTNLSLELKDFNYFTDLEAARLHRERRSADSCSIWEAVGRGLRLFVYTFFVDRLYRQGEVGLLYATIAAFTKFMIYAKLSERMRIQANTGIWTDQDRLLLTRFNVSSSDVRPVRTDDDSDLTKD